jgi:prepilin-type N-terminal cleavage/methylation domain-containing protein
MNMKPSLSPPAGRCARAYTLVEVMVSVGLLAIMLSATYPAFILGFASVKTTREDDRATQIVVQKLEGFRLLRFSDQLNYSSTFLDYYNPTNNNMQGLTNGSQGAVYYGTMTISTNSTTVIPSSASYANLVRLVTISVTWTNYVNSAPIAHTRQMQTLSAFYGLQNYLWGNGS